MPRDTSKEPACGGDELRTDGGGRKGADRVSPSAVAPQPVPGMNLLYPILSRTVATGHVVGGQREAGPALSMCLVST